MVVAEKPLTFSSNQHTIAAIATAPGRSGVGIVRVSGPKSKAIAEKISQITIKPRFAHFAKFYNAANNEIIDEGILLYFVAPNSFTGEEVVEFQTHGSPLVLDMLLKEIISCGAQLAKPGEFSERAFLNNKLDLTQAEAIADLINAQSEQAARSAMRSLQGLFSQKINSLVQTLISLRVFVEAAIDFPDEEIDFLHLDQITKQLTTMSDQMTEIFAQANRGRLLQEGMTIVIAGKPNAGKSSLLNLLAGDEVAIVTDIAGTTRDVIKQNIHLDGLPLHIIDTAGLRHTDDVVENEGVKRSLQQITQADRILLLIDSSYENIENDIELLWAHEVGEMPPKNKITLICNKIDLLDEAAKNKITAKNYSVDVISMSTKTNEGLNNLREYLKESVGYSHNENEGQFTARRRHLNALEKAQQNIKTARDFLISQQPYEIIAEELRLAQLELNSITGEFTSDDLLGEIFSSFCIGK
jgi:tRNA modification GTPase